MRKKITGILIVLVFITSTFVVSTASVAAGDSFGTISASGGDREVQVSSIDDLNRFIADSSDKGDTRIDIDLLGEKHSLSEPIIVKGSSISVCIKNGLLDMGNKNRAIEVKEGSGIALDLEKIIIQNCRSNDGGAMKIDAPGCTVMGGYFVNCMTSDNDSDGGAILVTSKGISCTIKSSVFSTCYAYGGKGGAIYSAAVGTSVNGCKFNEVDAARGKCIFFDAAEWSESGNTLPPWTLDCISSFDDKTASVLSEGSLWIVIGIAVAAAGVIVTIVVKKKKSSEA